MAKGFHGWNIVESDVVGIGGPSLQESSDAECRMWLFAIFVERTKPQNPRDPSRGLAYALDMRLRPLKIVFLRISGFPRLCRWIVARAIFKKKWLARNEDSTADAGHGFGHRLCGTPAQPDETYIGHSSGHIF